MKVKSKSPGMPETPFKQEAANMPGEDEDYPFAAKRRSLN